MYDPFDPFSDPDDQDPFAAELQEPELEFGTAVFGEQFFTDDPFLIDVWDHDMETILEQQEQEVEEYIRAADERASSFQRQNEILRNPELSGSIRGPFPNRKKARRYAATVPVRTDLVYDEYDDVWYVYVNES